MTLPALRPDHRILAHRIVTAAIESHVRRERRAVTYALDALLRDDGTAAASHLRRLHDHRARAQGEMVSASGRPHTGTADGSAAGASMVKRHRAVGVDWGGQMTSRREITATQARLGVDPSSDAVDADDLSVDESVEAELDAEPEPVRDDEREPVEQRSVYEDRGVVSVPIDGGPRRRVRRDRGRPRP